jgi:hypothetical protein
LEGRLTFDPELRRLPRLGDRRRGYGALVGATPVLRSMAVLVRARSRAALLTPDPAGRPPHAERPRPVRRVHVEATRITPTAGQHVRLADPGPMWEPGTTWYPGVGAGSRPCFLPQSISGCAIPGQLCDRRVEGDFVSRLVGLTATQGSCRLQGGSQRRLIGRQPSPPPFERLAHQHEVLQHYAPPATWRSPPSSTTPTGWPATERTMGVGNPTSWDPSGSLTARGIEDTLWLMDDMTSRQRGVPASQVVGLA